MGCHSSTPRKSTLGMLWLLGWFHRGFLIAAKEARALLNAVQSLLGQTFNARVDVFVDCKVLLDSCEKQISKSAIISDTLKNLFPFYSDSQSLSDLALCTIPAKSLEIFAGDRASDLVIWFSAMKVSFLDTLLVKPLWENIPTLLLGRWQCGAIFTDTIGTNLPSLSNVIISTSVLTHWYLSF